MYYKNSGDIMNKMLLVLSIISLCCTAHAAQHSTKPDMSDEAIHRVIAGLTNEIHLKPTDGTGTKKADPITPINQQNKPLPTITYGRTPEQTKPTMNDLTKNAKL